MKRLKNKFTVCSMVVIAVFAIMAFSAVFAPAVQAEDPLLTGMLPNGTHCHSGPGVGQSALLAWYLFCYLDLHEYYYADDYAAVQPQQMNYVYTNQTQFIQYRAA